MALTVVTDLLDPSCNAYADVAYVTTYIADRILDSALLDTWNDLSAPQKAAYVVNATRTLDNQIEWIGERYISEQRLRWPRVNVLFESFYITPPALPEQVKEAMAEVVVWMLQNSAATSVRQDSAYEAIRVGPIKIDFSASNSGAADKYLPDSVAIILRGLGVPVPPAVPGAKSVRMVRLDRA
jgi:hypothetical protein